MVATKKRIPMGKLVATRNCLNTLQDVGIESILQLIPFVSRHLTHDWGDVCAEDKKANDDAVIVGERVLSAYTVEGVKIWIITEWDRSVTTILLPEDY